MVFVDVGVVVSPVKYDTRDVVDVVTDANAAYVVDNDVIDVGDYVALVIDVAGCVGVVTLAIVVGVVVVVEAGVVIDVAVEII